MNKGELIKAMAEKAGFTNKDAAVAYEALVDSITEALKNFHISYIPALFVVDVGYDKVRLNERSFVAFNCDEEVIGFACFVNTVEFHIRNLL